jgi:hypothetical protein
MSDYTKRDKARAELLEAIVNYFRSIDRREDRDPEADEPSMYAERAKSAWANYRDLLDGKTENAVLDENRWYCPHCGTERPPHKFQLVGEVLMGIGALQYFNVICGNESCTKLLAVIGAGFMPEASMIAQARAHMAAMKPKA